MTSQSSRGEAEQIFNAFSIEITGLRPGEVVLGIRNVSRGALIAYRGKTLDGIETHIIPPRTKELECLRRYDDLWTMFIQRLGSIKFFDSKSFEEREQWLKDFESPGDVDISEMNGEVKILELGQSDLINKLDASQISHVCTAGWIKASDLRFLIPGKPGTNARRHTLFFLREFWTINTTTHTLSSANFLTFDIETGEIFKSGVPPTDARRIHSFDIPSKFGIRVSSRVTPLAFDALLGVAQSVLRRYGLGVTLDEDFAALKKATSGFTPAGFKSLMQKLIRFRPQTVLLPHEDEPLNAEVVLILSMVLLFNHPGSFVPDIKRFVSGAESVTKRLLVIIYEDSYFDIYTETTSLLQLVLGAFLFQRVSSFKPTEEFIGLCFVLAIRAIRETKYIADRKSVV